MTIKVQLTGHYCRVEQIRLAMHWQDDNGRETIYYPEPLLDLKLIDDQLVELSITAEDLHMSDEKFNSVNIIEYEEGL